MRTAIPFLSLLLLPLTGCVSYAVGTTAETLGEGERTFSSIMEVTPAPDPDAEGQGCPYGPDDPSCYDYGTTGGLARPMLSSEVRFGLSENADAGLRVIGYSGLVASYKHRLTPDSAAVSMAFMGGAGVLNGGNHAELEATFIISRAGESVSPYGGLRAMQAIALSPSVPHDRPTLGAFAGLRLGSALLGMSPEVGVFHDPSAMKLRRRTLVVVPSITLHGRGLLARMF